MIEIQVNNLVKSFEVGKNVLDGLTFQVDQGERVGLLGRNGAGKTTLFKILTGELDYDEGTVVVGQGRRVGLISQIPVYPAGCTVEDVLRSAFARLESLAEEMRALEARMAAGESDPAILKRYGTLSERFEAFGGYDTDVAVNKIANGLSIPDSQRSQLFDSLSGGEKTSCFWTSPPTTWTSTLPSGWRSTFALSTARWSPSPTTGISWTAPSPGSSRSRTGKRSFTAGITASMPWRRNAATRSG